MGNEFVCGPDGQKVIKFEPVLNAQESDNVHVSPADLRVPVPQLVRDPRELEATLRRDLRLDPAGEEALRALLSSSLNLGALPVRGVGRPGG